MSEHDSRGLSIFNKTLIIFLILIISVSGILTGLFYFLSKKSFEERIRERLLQQFSGISAYFSSHVRAPLVKDLKLISSNPVLDEFLMSTKIEKEVAAKAVEKLFMVHINYMDSYESIAYVDSAGMEKIKVMDTGKSWEYYDISGNGFITRVESAGPNGITIGDLQTNNNGNGSFSAGIFKTDPDIGEFGGAIIIDYSLESFFRYLDDIRILGENPIWVFTQDKKLIKQPDSGSPEFYTGSQFSEEFQGSPVLLMSDKGLIVYKDLTIIHGEPLLRLVLSVPEGLILKDIHKNLKMIYLFFALSVIMASILALYLSRHLSKPVIELARAAVRYSKGDLSARLNITAGGEVGTLIDKFNLMAENLQQTTVSKDYVDNILGSMIDTLVVVSPNGTILRTNTAVTKLLLYEEKELIGQPFGAIIDEKTPFSLNGTANDPVKDTSGKNRTYLTKDGRKIPVLFSSSPIHDINGVIRGTVCVAQDITDRKYAEESLLKEKTFSEAIINSMPGIFYLFDENGKFIRWNKNFETVTGYSTEEFGTKSPLDFFGAEEKGLIAEIIQEVFSKGQSSVEAHLVSIEGEKTPYYLTGVRMDGDNEAYLIGMGIDITDRRKAEQELSAFAQKLERSNAELQQFASIASHDLQEPLRMISSYVQLLEKKYKGKLDKDAEEFIHYAVDGAKRMQRLINDLLTYSRVGTRAKPFANTDVGAVLNDVLMNLQKAIEDNKAEITYGGMPEVMADEGQLTQLFQNLIGNAIKFHGEKAPKVHVSAKQEQDDWVFSVKDNGIGIEEKHKERIFQIFQRLHSRSEYEGTGIGLAICRKIVERHGGRIWVESEQGKGAVPSDAGHGTTFYFTIPLEGNKK